VRSKITAPWGDWLWWSAAAAYSLNRFCLKPLFGSGNRFLHGHFNDLLLVPAALPPLIFVYRALGIRTHDRPPTWIEIALHGAAWCLFFEMAGPALLHKGTADFGDVIAYATGAVAAGMVWNRDARPTLSPSKS
jgi:hypothetical protein